MSKNPCAKVRENEEKKYSGRGRATKSLLPEQMQRKLLSIWKTAALYMKAFFYCGSNVVTSILAVRRGMKNMVLGNDALIYEDCHLRLV